MIVGPLGGRQDDTGIHVSNNKEGIQRTDMGDIHKTQPGKDDPNKTNAEKDDTYNIKAENIDDVKSTRDVKQGTHLGELNTKPQVYIIIRHLKLTYCVGLSYQYDTLHRSVPGLCWVGDNSCRGGGERVHSGAATAGGAWDSGVWGGDDSGDTGEDGGQIQG